MHIEFAIVFLSMCNRFFLYNLCKGLIKFIAAVNHAIKNIKDIKLRFILKLYFKLLLCIKS